jgi:DNA-binding MarR family transcriptional regulator
MNASIDNEASIRELVGGLRLLVRAVYVDSAKMSRRYGLTGAQSSVVRTLFQNGPISSADLSRKLYVTPSNITGIIDRLDKKGLVERVPQANDRRVVRIQLTAAGLTLGKALPDPIEKKLVRRLAHMPHEHIQLLCDLTREILDAIDAKAVIETPSEFPEPKAAPPDL